jgi:ATP adenylyltransferase
VTSPSEAGDRNSGEGELGQLDRLQRLWTPWRMSYIRGSGPAVSGCPFCTLPRSGDDHAAFIVYRAQTVYVVLNAYPYNPGHCMVVPFRHVSWLDELTSTELQEIAVLTQRAVVALRTSSGAEAFNLGMNLGAAAGAGITDHLHQHVVPRWGGDTNFMPVVGQTRVLPELLEETYARLAPAFAEVAGEYGELSPP